MERKLYVALISEDPVFAGNLKKAIRESLDFVLINYLDSDSSFLASFPETKADIILSDQRDIFNDWKVFLEEILRQDPNSLVIYIVEDREKGKSVTMIRSGVYDVITPASLTRIQPLLHRALRDQEDNS